MENNFICIERSLPDTLQLLFTLIFLVIYLSVFILVTIYILKTSYGYLICELASLEQCFIWFLKIRNCVKYFAPVKFDAYSLLFEVHQFNH